MVLNLYPNEHGSEKITEPRAGCAVFDRIRRTGKKEERNRVDSALLCIHWLQET